jgi:ParB/RepB/Spo0J family partition protein
MTKRPTAKSKTKAKPSKKQAVATAKPAMRKRTSPEIAIAEIKITKRHRRDMGDIAELAANIEKTGLLHPIVVNSADRRLIAGERRVLAFKHLGRKSIPATVIDMAKVAEGEYAENTFRKDFTPSEVVGIRRELEPIEQAKAKERQRLS